MMNRFIFAAVLVAACSAQAATRNVYHYDASSGATVKIDENHRVKIFVQNRFAITTDGVPVVCLEKFYANDNGDYARCEDKNEKNAWAALTDPRIIPGWKADSYQITQGKYYRSVTIFFKKQ